MTELEIRESEIKRDKCGNRKRMEKVALEQWVSTLKA